MKYMKALNPAKSFFQLDHQSAVGRQAGKYVGPDGNVLFCFDGPHSAPTQHISEYDQVMVIGAGIGVTPVSSTLKSIVYHKWKFGLGKCYPDSAYFYWVCNHRDIIAFRWLIRIIKDVQDAMVHLRKHNGAQMASKHFGVHIFVTSVPKGNELVTHEELAAFKREEEADPIAFWGVPYSVPSSNVAVEKAMANFSAFDLFAVMLNPPSAHNILEDIHVYSGRPKWDDHFKAVSDMHRMGDIGVAFCGNPQIGRDLRTACYRFSKNRPSGIFKLHKENF